MSWLPSFLLYGGIAASIPIVLHLFFRSRYRVVQWAAMEFLLKSIQETSRRLKFQELLLLLLRVAVFTLLALVLALTLARIASNWGGGGAVDAVLILDVSGSMNAKEGTRTRFDLAREAAREIIDSLPSTSTVQILVTTDQTRTIGPRQPSNLDQARELLDKIDVSSRGTDFLAALLEAKAAFQRVGNSNREIYLISDMQKQGLMQASALKSLMMDFEREQTKFYAVHCGSQNPKNATIEGILPQSGILHTGVRASFAVLVKNTGTQVVRDLKVTLKVVGQEKGEDSRTLPSLEPGELKPVPLAIEMKQGGFQVLSASIEPDDLAADNRYDQVVRVHDQVRVLVVDGAPNRGQPDRSASHFLTRALAPVSETSLDKYYIKTRTCSPREASAGMLSDRDLVILVDCPLNPRLANKDGSLSADFLNELDKFVRKGNGLIVFAGPHALPEEYNEELATKRALLPLRLGKVVPEKPPEKPDAKSRIALDASSIKPHSFLARFGENPLAKFVGSAEVLKYVETRELTPEDRESGNVEVLMTYNTGKPALVIRSVERGKVLLCTTTADGTWGDVMPLGHISVPLMHDSLAHLLQTDVQTLNRRVGQPLSWVPTARAEQVPHLLTPPSGDEVRLGLAKGDDGPARYLYERTDQAGIYRIKPELDAPERTTNLEREDRRDPGVVFAVTADPLESLGLEPGTNGEVDDGLGTKVAHLVAGQGLLSASVTERRAQEWTLLIALVLCLLLAETALAWYCGRAG